MPYWLLAEFLITPLTLFQDENHNVEIIKD